ncbi:MAG: ATP-binding protein [Clostridiales bacterium]|nr:ATP-binding protein [Clostridiales bacterium]
MFIGREAELQFLEDRYISSHAEFVVLYGRRRVGKTETLKQFCEGKPHVFYSCTQCTDQAQLAKFSAQLLREDLPAKQYVTVFPDWEKAFHSILDLPYGEKKKLVVIDEFPYMCQRNTAIPSLLQNMWDAEFKDHSIMLILCGSAMSFIEKELLDEKNPLYGRATGIYKMNPMVFYDAKKFFPDYSPEDQILAYAVLGGIPHYLNQFQNGLSLEENIKKNILTKGCILYSEVEFLLHQEMRETPVYNSLIESVALGSTKLNEISQKSLLCNNSKTSVYLKNLMELGIVEREFSVDISEKERGNSNRGMYRLTDNFFRFWYAFGFGNYSQLEDGDVDGVYRYLIAPELHAFASGVFEDVCREFVRELQKRNKLPFRYNRIGRWMGKTTVREVNSESGCRMAETEIDILALSQRRDQYLIGECKFKNAPFRYSEFLDTTAKLAAEKKQAEFYYYLFSASGFDEMLLAEAEKSDTLKLYTAEEVVQLR